MRQGFVIGFNESYIARLDKVRGGVPRGQWLEHVSEQAIHIMETTNTPVPSGDFGEEVDEGIVVETRKPSEVYNPLTPGGGVANALRFGDPLGPDADKDTP